MRIINDIKLDFKDVLILPKRSTLSSRSEVELQRTYTFKHSGLKWTGVPIMAANMDGVGTLAMAKSLREHQMFTCLVKSYNEDELGDLASEGLCNHIAVSTGTSDSDFLKLRRIVYAYPEVRFICIDVANGYQQRFVEYVAKVRQTFPHCTIIAGNVVTAEMTEELILSGADMVKVGIGPGSVCTTRVQTGVGYPQLSAIIECADAAHGLGGHIVADGGCTCPGDVAKAYGAGADFVMLGGMLAGHDQGGGTVIHKSYLSDELDNSTGKQYVATKDVVQFYGMSSDTAMNKHSGGVANYRSSEGRTVTVPYRGDVNATVLDLLGGLRSTCTYVGASKLKELSKRTTFVRVTQQVNNPYGK